ncbi:hypothetical protein SAMN04489724_0235 [Algoriphagus locisalis]|uniref:Uncharacterized protein n=1 Tax=Algoriphagus locisalis TaxID=305507 RepID=A0A1I7E806_9BACT|nr:hypothetical protein [Algoriphagus locisalis]SFU20096.1 hypothetical protein SAMN04489724_0235 [Algoriphagus locisalis]
MKTLAKTSAKTSAKRKDGNDLARNKWRSTQSPKGSSDIYQKFTDGKLIQTAPTGIYKVTSE